MGNQDREALLAQLKELEKELEIDKFQAPVGVSHVEVKETKVSDDKSGFPYLRVSYRVLCGGYKDKQFSTIHGYFASRESSSSSKPFNERQKIRAAMFKQDVYGVYEANPSSDDLLLDVLREIKALNPMEAGEDEVRGIMDSVGELVGGRKFYVRGVEKDDKVNVRIIRFDHKDATCECEGEEG